VTGGRKKLLHYTDHLVEYYMNFLYGNCYTVLEDLNINIQEDGCGHKQLLDTANIYKLTMTINTPTWLTESTATIIDQNITNMPAQCYSTDVMNSLLSDHYAQCITITMTIPQQIVHYKVIGKVTEASIIGLCS
jgi:hypothetical protein